MHAFAMGAVLHTLVVAVLAFFVLFAASKADGFVKLLGLILGWILLLAAILGLAVGLYCAATGHHPAWMEHHAGWMMKGDDEGGSAAPPAQPAPPMAPAKPAEAAPAKPK